MKKLLSLLCSFLLVFLLFSSASAEENSMSWEDFSVIVDSVFGENAHFIRLDEVDAKIWIPDYLESITLSEEDVANGSIAMFMPEDESEMVYISYFDVNYLSLEAFQTQLSLSGISANIVDVNGIPALLYYSAESDSIIADYATVDGYFLQLILYPASDDFLTIILSSVQPDVKETEEAVYVDPVNPVSGLIYK